MKQQISGDNVKRIIIGTILFLFFTSFMNLNAQWARTYDVFLYNKGRAIQKTNDGGYIMAGFGFGYGLSAGWNDFLVIKLSSSGEVEWEKSYGGSEHDYAYSIQQTNDGGYVVAGETLSFGAGNEDAWIIKLSSDGAIEWQKTYGGYSFDTARSIQQASDGGYVVAGMSSSFGFVDLWIIKLSSTGDIEWEKIYGDRYDYAYSMQPTDDGGYIVAGSYGVVLKISQNGDQEWFKTIEGNSPGGINLYSIQPTSDGGYIAAGDIKSYAGIFNFLVLKLSSEGDIEWQRSYGGRGYDHAYAVQQTDDGGYVVAGESSNMAWILKLNPAGGVEWQKKYRDFTYTKAYSIQQIGSGGYIVAGQRSSTGILVLKLHADGSIDPSCIWLEDTDAFVVNTHASLNVVTGTPQNTSASYSDTQVSAVETGATTDLLCGAPKYALTILTTTGGSTDPSPGGYSYDYGEDTTIDAAPETGYEFSHWTGNVPSGHENDNPLTITMDSDKSVKANFVPVTGNYELIINAASGGSTDPSPGAYSYAGGTTVYITALPDSGNSFSHWTGDVPSGHENDNPISMTLDSNKSITPHFSIAKAWTFMVYLDGDNNLETDAIYDFLEMAMVGSGDYINIVVQFDRTSGYDIGYGNWTSTKRFFITNGMEPTSENALEDLGELNHGDPLTLLDFVSWAKAAYPAENYALILWNHGGGWREAPDKKEPLEERFLRKEDSDFRAVCWDDTDGGDCLFMDEVQGALNSSGGADLIGFDACLMGMIEVAYEIRNNAEIMVGSEETVPVWGWPYHTIFHELAADPFRSPPDLATLIVDRYYESYQGAYNFTHAAIDLNNMEDLADALSSFAQIMMDNWNSDRDAVGDAAESVQTEIDNTIIHEMHGSSWPEAHGLAIYFPKVLSDFSPDYNENTIDFLWDTRWEEFLNAYYNSMRGSWIAARRAGSQQFSVTQHIDLYHFCGLVDEGRHAIDFYVPSQIPHEYVGGGTAQDFHDDDASMLYPLPFDFSYFGEVKSAGTNLYICTNGFVTFGDASTDLYNTGYELVSRKRIAPFWTDLRTDFIHQPGEDIYITENPDNLIIRWVAETYGYGQPVNFELILYEDGRIQFNYDGGNANMQRSWDVPTVAISKGDGVNYHAAICNGENTFTDAESVLFTPQEVQFFDLTISNPFGGTTDPSPGLHSYAIGSDIEVEAIPGSNYVFEVWTGDVPAGHENDNPITITMNSNKSIGVSFIHPQCILTIASGRGGTTDPPPGSHSYDQGAQVSVTAIPNSGYEFNGWNGDASGTTNPVTVTLDEDKMIAAVFTSTDDSGGGGGGMGEDSGDSGGEMGCFIATAAYGSPAHPYIGVLRDFRDRYLMTNGLGREFVELYYKYSPFFAEIIAEHKVLKIAAQINLMPLVILSVSMVHLGPANTAAILLLIFMAPIFLVSLRPKRDHLPGKKV